MESSFRKSFSLRIPLQHMQSNCCLLCNISLWCIFINDAPDVVSWAPCCCAVPCSVRYPVVMGSSPEPCSAWAPLSRSPSALCSACTCPNPSPSRAATWAAAERRDRLWLPPRATQIHRHTTRAIFLLQQRQPPSNRPQQPVRHLNPVSTHTL